MRTGRETRTNVIEATRAMQRLYGQVGRGKFCSCMDRLGYDPGMSPKRPVCSHCRKPRKEVA